jgi:HK97 family phage prohead protease
MTLSNASGELTLAGYASLFDVPDISGDIVKSGAFSASLLKLGGAPLPMLFGHETRTPIGVWDRVLEDSKGLYLQGRLLPLEKPRRHLARLIQTGAVSGLSIGYRALRANRRPAGGRDLLELDLWEVSIVAFPMLREARLTTVQSSPHSYTAKRKIA